MATHPIESVNNLPKRPRLPPPHLHIPPIPTPPSPLLLTPKHPTRNRISRKRPPLPLGQHPNQTTAQILTTHPTDVQCEVLPDAERRWGGGGTVGAVCVEGQCGLFC